MMTILVISLIVSIASSITTGVQQAQAAQAASDAAKADAKLQAAEAQQSARQLRKEHSRELALQRVRFGKAGVIAAVGTPLDVLAENAGEFEIEARAVERFGKNVLAFGESAASNFRRQGQLAVAGTSLAGAARAASIAAGGFSGAPGGAEPTPLTPTGQQIASGATLAT